MRSGQNLEHFVPSQALQASHNRRCRPGTDDTDAPPANTSHTLPPYHHRCSHAAKANTRVPKSHGLKANITTKIVKKANSCPRLPLPWDVLPHQFDEATNKAIHGRRMVGTICMFPLLKFGTPVPTLTLRADNYRPVSRPADNNCARQVAKAADKQVNNRAQ
ncbi:hypothetical protein Bbelb_346260 [Branchiostoma belcheri]|nr:hypothetical protein Bbelb_346260 [Branchiostoma belcheri]